MIKKILFFLVFIPSLSFAQFSIQGEMQPVKDYPWMLLYKLQGAKQDFIAYDSIKEGRFTIKVPNNATSGIYRLVYDQKKQLFIDVIYDKEDIDFKFHPEYPNRLVQFSTSQNNELFFNYLRAISPVQQRLDSLQVAYFTPGSEVDAKLYKKWHQELLKIQTHFDTTMLGFPHLS